jgi:hypothetical protein
MTQIQIDDTKREATPEELEAIENWRKDVAANEKRIAQEKQLAKQAKASAEAKLIALGLTIDDLKALGLG